MAPELDVVEISSDDEEDSGVGIDDVVIMEKLSAPAAKRKKGLGTGYEAWKVEEEEDDCLILDFDPDIPVPVFGDKEESGADELVIVGEKGQLACRDYPHSRHLCVIFPFSDTPHENYCSLCHCYVCDSPAPCKYWGNGKLKNDHCHSTDKEGKWKAFRESFKQKNLVSSQPLTEPDKLPSSEMTGSHIPMAQCHPNPVQEPAQARRSSSLLPCSAAKMTNINAIDPRHHRKTLHFYTWRQRFGTYPVVPNPPVSRTIIQREHSVRGTLAAQISHVSRRGKDGTTHLQSPRTGPVQRGHSPSEALAAQTNNSSRLSKVGTTNQILDLQQNVYHRIPTKPRTHHVLPSHFLRAQSSAVTSAAISMDQIRIEPLRSTPERLQNSLSLSLPTVFYNSNDTRDIVASMAPNRGAFNRFNNKGRTTSSRSFRRASVLDSRSVSNEGE